MKKILNLVLGLISTGELSIAFSFAEQQDRKKQHNHFLLPKEKSEIATSYPNHQIFFLSTKNTPQHNQHIVLDIIDKEKYDLIVLFDVFTFEYEQHWTGINVSVLKKTRIPLISLDEYEYTKAGYKLDYYGMFVRFLPPLLDECQYIIKNCPLSMPDANQGLSFQGKRKNEFYYRVFHQLNCSDKLHIQRQKDKYLSQVSESAKIVFFTTSEWEVRGAYSFSAQNKLASWIGVIVHEYLKELDINLILIHVGTEKWKIAKQDRKVSYIHYDSLPVADFESMLQISDLFLTLNILSITLSKAIMFGVPSLVLNNSKLINFSLFDEKLKIRPMWYQNMAKDVAKIYPFSASMFGWSNFLQTVLQNNQYLETFHRVDMFRYNEVKKTLWDMLMNQTVNQATLKSINAFLSSYRKLNDAQKILEDIFDDINKRKKELMLLDSK